MISLFIDTCHFNLIVGIYRDEEVVVLMNEKNDNHLSERLLPMIEAAFEKAKLDIKDVGRIIVANGPGSFTGIRIGVTVAKTLAYSLGCKIYTVSELKIMSTSPFQTKYIVPLIDARRGYVYAAMYSKSLDVVIDDQYILLDDLKQKIKDICPMDQVTFITYEEFEGISTAIPTVALDNIIFDEKNVKNMPCHFVNPNYLKKTEAEEKLGV